ncbi:methylmalonyl-CoA mutase [Corynebacterium sp. sy017]|uniref:methylmalonyl-CoA mutase family protein n=1 Tax=unclassified Corynebacterium TaxID=2624378 RepID=UPI001186A37E|nr:methylmalonyl-CoA mutase family protein [Corynebacterium sp. SY003]MBP3087629.1 methylmalonyl-CoA mutase [Corynebacterium sp. sy017]TSD92195.1 methylmalonyl-CoA mutase [Corynebacterium sp. SY003]
MVDTHYQLDENFSESQQAWYKAVAGVFARVEKKNVEDVSLDSWRKLIKTTYDGIEINPLYTRENELDELQAPGAFPYTRGAKNASTAHNYGWGVTETFDSKNTNEQLLDAMANGTTDIVLAGKVSVAQLLKGVMLSLAPVRLAAGNDTLAVAEELLEFADSQEHMPVSLELGATPLSSLIDDSPSISLTETIALAQKVVERDNVRPILIDAVSFANQGATDAEEVGLALAAGVEYVRSLESAGIDIDKALDQLSFRYSISDDQFAQIAKLRVARKLWARVAEILGYPEHGSAPQHALSAPIMFSQRDPWVNMLRCTVAAFAAGVGGATDVEVLPFDWAIPGGLAKTSRTFAARIARNTNLLLLEESHLGHVLDPAGGSYYVEELTNQLTQKAWQVFSDIEAQGGFLAAHSAGAINELLDSSYAAIRADIAHRRKQITAINEFPNLAEAPLTPQQRVEPDHVRRWAADFEALRNRSDAYLEAHGQRPCVALIPLGPLAKHNVRTGFATNLLASGGISVVNPGAIELGSEEFNAAASESDVLVICGTNQEYENSGARAVELLRTQGEKTILLAGSPKAGLAVDGHLNLTIDAVKTLSELLEQLGA